MEEEFSHNIRAVLKPKAKEEFLKDIKGQYVTNEMQATYVQHYKEEFPEEYLSLKQQIDRLLKKKYPQYHKTGGYIDIRRTHMYYSDHKVYANVDGKKYEIKIVLLNMMPTRRIPEIENIRSGTQFYITKLSQVETIIRFLETH